MAADDGAGMERKALLLARLAGMRIAKERCRRMRFAQNPTGAVSDRDFYSPIHKL